jgi:hypothetical protein
MLNGEGLGGCSVEMIRSIDLTVHPLDFQGDKLEIGSWVLFAFDRGVLGEGKVVEITRGGMVTVQSLTSSRRVSRDSSGCILVSVG